MDCAYSIRALTWSGEAFLGENGKRFPREGDLLSFVVNIFLVFIFLPESIFLDEGENHFCER